VGRERTISREECPATSAGHSSCLREVNVPDGRRSPLPSPDTVVCQERVARHLAFCPTPAPVTIRYGVPLVTTANPATLSTMGDREVADGRFASTRQNRTAGMALRAAKEKIGIPATWRAKALAVPEPAAPVVLGPEAAGGPAGSLLLSCGLLLLLAAAGSRSGRWA
jgi:hypothetical protein